MGRNILRALLAIAINASALDHTSCDDSLSDAPNAGEIHKHNRFADLQAIVAKKCGSCHFGISLDYSNFPFANPKLKDDQKKILADLLERNALPPTEEKWNVPTKERMPPLNAPDLNTSELKVIQEVLASL